MQREADGSWRIRITGPEGVAEERFDVLLVCSGHHFDPVKLSRAICRDHAALAFLQDIRAIPRTARPRRRRWELGMRFGRGHLTRRSANRAQHAARQHIVPKIIFGMPVDIAYRRVRCLPDGLLRFPQQTDRGATQRVSSAIASDVVMPAKSLPPGKRRAGPSQGERHCNCSIWLAACAGMTTIESRGSPNVIGLDTRPCHCGRSEAISGWSGTPVGRCD